MRNLSSIAEYDTYLALAEDETYLALRRRNLSSIAEDDTYLALVEDEFVPYLALQKEIYLALLKTTSTT